MRIVPWRVGVVRVKVMRVIVIRGGRRIATPPHHCHHLLVLVVPEGSAGEMYTVRQHVHVCDVLTCRLLAAVLPCGVAPDGGVVVYQIGPLLMD